MGVHVNPAGELCCPLAGVTVTADQIRADPGRYGLPAYPWATAEHAAELFNRWEADRGKPSPALCPRCGVVLRFADPGQQLHPWCDPNHPLNQPTGTTPRR